MKAFKRAGSKALIVAIAGFLFLTIDSRAQVKGPTPVTVRGISKPSAILDKLQFANPGLISEVKVKEGDRVKKGQPLILQDDRWEVNQLKQFDIEASSTVRIDLYTQSIGIKQLQLDVARELAKNGGNASPTEVQEKILAVAEAKAQKDAAILDRDGYKLKAVGQTIKLEQMKIMSPVDGVVTALNIRQGEMASPQAKDPPVVIVQNDPLWCDFNLPTDQSSRLKVGDKLEVRHAIDKEDQWVSGKVIFINPFANTNTQTIRVELANPNYRDSGMEVMLRVPERIANPAVANVPGR